MSAPPFDNSARDRFADQADTHSSGERSGAWQRGARSWLALVLFIIVCYAAAAIGALLTGRSLADWYPGLVKPLWNPPDWVFGPVWTLLYGMMAIAAWLVWRDQGVRAAALPLAWFGVQLVLNVLWSGIFFGLRSPGAAVFEIVLLWLAILATLLRFWRIDRAAGALLVPYLAWVSFAAVLNFAVWQLNR